MCYEITNQNYKANLFPCFFVVFFRGGGEGSLCVCVCVVVGFCVSVVVMREVGGLHLLAFLFVCLFPLKNNFLKTN